MSRVGPSVDADSSENADDDASQVSVLTLSVGADDVGLRLDRLLASAADIGLSRSRVKRLIVAGAVTVNDVGVTDPNFAVPEGARLVIDLPEPEDATPVPQAIPLDVIYEDDAVVVINKPVGLVVHPGAGVPDGTLVNALLAHCGDSLSGIGGVRRPGIVHRLDKDTSGLMVVAKSDLAHRSLAAQFADHGRTGVLERGYLALVWGAPKPKTGRIETQIARSKANRLQMAVVKSGGRVAITHYKAIHAFGPKTSPLASLVECRLETGRTHQVRVHLTHIGHPLIGDPDYGRGFQSKIRALPPVASQLAASLERQALHAYLLVFAHPLTDEVMRFEAPPPRDIADLQAALATGS